MERLNLTQSDGYETTVYRKFPNYNQPLKGIIQIVHGSCEHMGRYKTFMTFLNSRGYGVYGQNHRGHDRYAYDHKRQGYFGEKDGWHKLVEDTKRLNEEIHRAYPNAKIFMLGHSMGSFIARSYIAKYSETIDGVILTGTTHQNQVTLQLGKKIADFAIKRGKGEKAHHLLDQISYGSFHLPFKSEKDSLAWLTSDVEIRRLYKEDPLCGFKFTAQGFYDMFTGMQEMIDIECVKKIDKNLPVLILSGKEDPLSRSGKAINQTKELFAQAGLKTVEVKLYEGMRHEILNEVNKTLVYQDLLEWLEKNLK